MKFGIITDSTFYLSKEQIKEMDIKQVSINIIDKEDTIKELETTPDVVLGKIKEGHKLSTSQPSPGEFLDVYERTLESGYDCLFVLTLAKPLSGTYQSALLAQKMLDEPDNVHVFESKMAAFGNEMLALKLYEFITKGLSKEEIIKRMNHLIESSELIFTVEGLYHLARSGRLSKAKALVGTVLRVKPLIKMVDGKLDLFDTERTHKKVVRAIIDRMKETTVGAKTITVRVLSHNSLAPAEALYEEIKKEFSDVEITFNTYLGPVFSLHLGTTGYGVSWCSE